MRRGQISIEFVIAGVIGILLAGTVLAWAAFFSQTESQKGTYNQLREIGQGLADAMEHEGEYHGAGDCLSYFAPLVFDASERSPQSCRIQFEKGAAGAPDQLRLFYPKTASGPDAIEYDVNLATKNLNGFANETVAYCGDTIKIKGNCP